jgi:hypothetical protein
MPGWVEGKVIEVVRSSKEVEGKQIKASKDDPWIRSMVVTSIDD